MEKKDKRQVSPLVIDPSTLAGHRIMSAGSYTNNPGHLYHVTPSEHDHHNHLHFPHINVHHGFWTVADGHESPLSHFVTPLFEFLRLIFMTHVRFQFDEKEKRFVYRPGSTFRKLICLVLQTCLVIQQWSQEKLVEGFLGGRNIAGLFKIMGIFYIALMISLFHSLMTKGSQLEGILNFMQSMTVSVASAGCKMPRKIVVRSLSTGLLLFYILYTVLYASVNADGSYGFSVVEGLDSFFTHCTDQGARKLLIMTTQWNVSQVQAYQFSKEMDLSSTVLVLLGVLQVGVEVMVALSWSMAFLMITMWGLLFWKVLHGFFDLISNSTERNTMEDIRKFNTITRIINKFSAAMGWAILTAAATGVLHFSVNVIDLFKDTQPWSHRVVVAFGLTAFGILLLAAAQVNQTASKIIDVMKDRYQEENVWKEFHGNCVETTQGMILVLHEIQNNSIGFSGLGFFTITYSFIGTVLSLISSYSIVVMQFQT